MCIYIEVQCFQHHPHTLYSTISLSHSSHCKVQQDCSLDRKFFFSLLSVSFLLLYFLHSFNTMADKIQRMITYLTLLLPLTQAFAIPPSHGIRSVPDDVLLQLRGLGYNALLDPRDFTWNDPFTYGALETRDLYPRGMSAWGALLYLFVLACGEHFTLLYQFVFSYDMDEKHSDTISLCAQNRLECPGVADSAYLFVSQTQILC